MMGVGGERNGGRREGKLWLVRVTATFLVNVELHYYRYQ